VGWKYATAFVVVLMVLNPEIADLALFIDAIGLEMFLMLLEIQLATVLSILFRNKLKPAIAVVRRVFTRCFPRCLWRSLLQYPQCLLMEVPGQATLMHVLVFSAAVGVAL
jgi:hypothetical protein